MQSPWAYAHLLSKVTKVVSKNMPKEYFEKQTSAFFICVPPKPQVTH